MIKIEPYDYEKHHESGEKFLEVARKDYNLTPEDLTNLTQREYKASVIYWVATKDGEVIGAIFCITSPNLHKPRYLISSEIHFYVHPNYRGSSIAYKLYLAWETTCKKLHISEMHISGSPSVTERFANRLGFGDPLTIYRKEI